ncbi:hypothetical protein BMS3Abin04_00033 [bacterium BMS3Abin04]|nr:hypothetical protein BMS3Abin04_00033 [bacterium BMS3Abin04]
MNFKNKNLPLNWIYLPRVSIVLTVIVFTILGIIVQGDPNKLLTKMGLESAIAAFGLTIIGSILAVFILGYLLHRVC